MQHLNYFTLKALAAVLQAELTGGLWVEAFSQVKDECIVVAKGKTQTLFLRVGCAPAFSYLVVQEGFKRAHRNSVNLFQMLEGQSISKVGMIEGERLIFFKFLTGYNLVLKMYGNRSNILLLGPDPGNAGAVTAIFRNQLKDDFNFKLPALPAKNSSRLWPKDYPQFDRYLKAKIESSVAAGVALPEAIAGVEQEAGRLWYVATEPVGFWVLHPPAGLGEVRQFTAVLPALEFFLRNYFSATHLGEAKQRLLQLLTRQQGYLQVGIVRAEAGLHLVERKRSAEELGHLLMANLHLIPPEAEATEVFDFYRDVPITITLNPRLSPQENAAHYYTQHKANTAKQVSLKARLKAAQEELVQVNEALTTLSSVQDLEAATHFEEVYASLLKPIHTTGSKASEHFKTFQYGGYTIRVGRNAENNERLTFGEAGKQDLWLHARGSAGAHVVIRQRPGSNYPKPVIEYAAGLAAWFSPQRGSGLVPVSYTLRKYVRKNKHLTPGQVIVAQEAVVLVPPIKPETTEELAAD